MQLHQVPELIEEVLYVFVCICNLQKLCHNEEQLLVSDSLIMACLFTIISAFLSCVNHSSVRMVA